MADRSVRVRLDADVKGYQAAMRTAVSATEDFAKRADGYVQNHKDSINDLSNTALGLGAGFVGATALAAKAAVDWESAWAGVQKTVDGTDEQMGLLEAGLRDMAKELPATHTEIAAVAEAAGQLGIATPNIESFTRTMIDLGESTNMSAEEAATALARFVNITGTAQGDIGRLGASVVGLGNNFATTESEIVDMSMRIAGAAAQAGLSEGEILGMAAALSSVGIEAEAGGTAISTTMKRIGMEVDTGGDKLGTFARVAGMSAEEFATAWRTDPAEALDAFITGLADTEQMGMSTNQVLSELGITAIRESDALLRLSASTGLLTDAMTQGNEQFELGTALAEEASKRYQTVESRLAAMRNAFVDAGIDIGGAVAPALGDVADNVSFLVGRFQELPDSVKTALGVGTGVLGMSLLAVGGLGRAMTAASDLKLAMDNLGIAADGTNRKMKLLGAGTAAGIAITGLALAVGHFVNEAATAERHAEQLADTFDTLTGAATADTDRMILEQMSETIEATDWRALDDLGVSVTDVIAAVKAGGPELESLRNELMQLGYDAGPEAQEAIGALERAIGPANDAFVTGQQEAAFMRDALGDLAGESGHTAEQQDLLAERVAQTGVKIDGTIESLKEFTDLLFEAGLITMSTRDAQAALEESTDAVGETVDELIEKHGGLGVALNDAATDFDLTTEAGRTANDAFQEVARSGMDLASSMAEADASQEEIQASLSGTYDDLVTAAEQLGITGDAAHDLAREVLGVPEGVSIDTWMDHEAEQQARDTQAAIANIDRQIRVSATLTYYEGNLPANARRNVPSQHQAGFASGGYTGNGAKYEPAGIVHRGEWVTTKEKTAKYRPVLEAIHAGTYSLPGYAAGGYVTEPQGMVLPYEPRRAQVATGNTAAPGLSLTQNLYGPDARVLAAESEARFDHKARAMTAGYHR